MKATTSLLSALFVATGLIGGLVAAWSVYIPFGGAAALGSFIIIASGCWFYAAVLAILDRMESHLAFLAHGPDGAPRKRFKASRILW